LYTGKCTSGEKSALFVDVRVTCCCTDGVETIDDDPHSSSLLRWLQNKLASIMSRIRGNAVLSLEHLDDRDSVASSSDEVDADTAETLSKPSERTAGEGGVHTGPTASVHVPKSVSFSNC